LFGLDLKLLLNSDMFYILAQKLFINLEYKVALKLLIKGIGDFFLQDLRCRLYAGRRLAFGPLGQLITKG